MYDVNELNKLATGQLKELYERITGNTLRRHSDSWEGPCPKCDGDNRFWISDKTPDHGYCRNCNRPYKAIDIVTAQYPELSFYEACNKLAELLGVSDSSAVIKTYSSVPNRPVQPVMKLTTPETPSYEWQSAVLKEVITARNFLWSADGCEALQYLRARGFTDKTIRDYWIGYNPNYHVLDIQHNGEPVKALTGYYIPTFLKLHDSDTKDTVLMRVKVRTPDAVRKANPDIPKYLFISGGKSKSLFCAQYARPRTGKYHPNIIYVEGEFDAMTINQTAGDICKAVTFGSHGYIGNAETWQSWYRIPEHTVICFDNDSDPKIMESVRKDELKLRKEIIKAQSLDAIDIRSCAPVIRHLPERYHDWNDILKEKDGAQIIRNILTGFFGVLNGQS